MARRCKNVKKDIAMIPSERFDYRKLTVEEYLSPLGRKDSNKKWMQINEHVELNQYIDKCLQEGEWQGTFEITDFLHRLYEHYFDIIVNKKNAFPFDDLGLENNRQRYFFGYFLYHALLEIDYNGFDDQEQSDVLSQLELLDSILGRLEKEISHPLSFRSPALYDFIKLKVRLDSLDSPEAKEHLLVDVISTCGQANILFPDKDQSQHDFVQLCQLELDRIQANISLNQLPKEKDTRSAAIKNNIGEYGFFDLPMVRNLTEVSKERLVGLIASNKLPYIIAMFDYLGFLKHLIKEHFQSKDRMAKAISKWFNSDKDGRTIEGHINSLVKRIKEDKERYTAYLHKEIVIKDYQELK